jgi:hypothetical protein
VLSKLGIVFSWVLGPSLKKNLLIGAIFIVSAILTVGDLPLQYIYLQLTIMNSGLFVSLELGVNCLLTWGLNWNRSSFIRYLLSLFIYAWVALRYSY